MARPTSSGSRKNTLTAPISGSTACGPPRGDPLIADLDRDRDVHHRVAVNVADLAPLPQAVPCAPEAMPVRRHPRPTHHLFSNRLARAFDGHTITFLS